MSSITMFQVRREMKYTWYKIQGKKGFDDSFTGNRSSVSLRMVVACENKRGGTSF